jgi:hypothetical protein
MADVKQSTTQLKKMNSQYQPRTQREGYRAANPLLQIKINKNCFVNTISNLTYKLPFTRNQPLKSADDQYTGILKNKIQNLGSLI